MNWFKRGLDSFFHPCFYILSYDRSGEVIGLFSTAKKAKEYKLYLRANGELEDISIWGEILDYNTPKYRKQIMKIINKFER